MINVNHLVRVTNAKYNGFVKRFTGEKGLQEALDYETFVFNALIRYAEDGNVAHLNNCVNGARNMMRVRLTTKLLKGFSAHSYNGKLFEGEARKGKLRMLRRMSENEIAFKVAEVLEKENEESKKAEAEFDLDKYAEIVAKKLIAKGANIIDFEAAVESKIAAIKAAA